MNHHGIFKDIERQDHTLVVLNLLLLMSICCLPFPTAVLAENLEHPSHRETSLLLYTSSLTAPATFFNALWLYASVNRRLIDEHVSDVGLQSRTRRYLAGPVLYGVGIPLTLLSSWATLALYVGLSTLYLLPLNDAIEGSDDA